MLLEDEDLVARLLDEEAFTRTSTGGARSPARSSWITRMSRLDYRALGGRQLFRAADVELFRGSPSLGARPGVAPNGAVGSGLSAPRGLPLEPTGEDVVLRVPLRVTRAGAERLFADELWFLLAPSGGGYRIREIVEDFTLP
jgi:hypothetical protein